MRGKRYFLRGEDQRGQRGYLCALYGKDLKPRYFVSASFRIRDERYILARESEIERYKREAQAQGIRIIGIVEDTISTLYPKRPSW